MAGRLRPGARLSGSPPWPDLHGTGCVCSTKARGGGAGSQCHSHPQPAEPSGPRGRPPALPGSGALAGAPSLSLPSLSSGHHLTLSSVWLQLGGSVFALARCRAPGHRCLLEGIARFVPVTQGHALIGSLGWRLAPWGLRGLDNRRVLGRLLPRALHTAECNTPASWEGGLFAGPAAA